MTTKRTVVRSLAFTALTGSGFWLGTSGALAATPESWPEADNPSGVHALFVFGGTVLGVIALLWLLTYLPSILRSSKFDESTAFVEQPEWFGGPRNGAADQPVNDTSETGGSGGKW